MSSIYVPEVIKIIQTCVDIEIKINDEFPSSICGNCSEQIFKFSSFREVCKTSHNLLQKIIHDSQNNTDYDKLKNSVPSTSVSEINTVNIKEELLIKDESQLKSEPFDFENNKSDLNDDDEDDNNGNNEEEEEDSFEDDEKDAKPDFSDEDETYTEMDSNKIDKTSNKTVECRICGKMMQERTLLGHLRRHQQGKKHKCDQCSKAYREPCELAKHLQRVHHTKGDVSCPVCNKTFLIQAQLDFHLKRHFKKKHQCDICGKECYKSAKLKRHKEIHEKREKSFFCFKCDSAFLREASLKLHVKKYHSDTPLEKQACPLCGKVVYNVRLHTLHTHSNVRPHKCDQCEKAFTFKSVLVKHVREKHLGIIQEFKALCPTCGKACPSQGELKKHLRTHIDERQFDCHLCTKKYKSRDGLRNHLKVHAGLRPYVCTYCSKGFHTNTILKNHLRTHTGERPFACHICGRAFTQKVSLRTHMKVHST
ncbi:zinc finger protein 878-like [Chrysoperla carnea]|uniref:zinc finger protein 878-like n=1 Tax=Chrysoperla carnea TaxID=189513 RepID=UPI001D093A09|nr:zinc finger protein 878-like [Chrysoperla carnea]